VQKTGHATSVLVGRYALESELGRSETGLVWLGEDLLLGRAVAVKLVHPDLGDDPAFAASLAEAVRRAASLSAPGIARLLDSGEQDGVPFLVSEHVDGASARALLAERGRFPIGEAVGIAAAVLSALEPVHTAGVLHLHLELDDVLLGPDGHVRVTGLGMGPAVTQSRPPGEAARLLRGDGLAPEQATSGAVDARTDVFAVGALLFALLTGQAPAGRRSPSAIRPSLPRALDRVVARALAPDPVQRFDDLSQFSQALRAAESTVSTYGGTRHGGWAAWLGVPGAIALVAAVVIGAGLWLGRIELGGPLGIRAANDPGSASPASPPSPTLRTLRPVSVRVFDPAPGDGTENDSTAPSALDGDPLTAWRSENYFDGRLNKEGVGLVFDLGRSEELVGFRLLTPAPGFVFRLALGDDPEALVGGVGAPHVASSETRGALRGSGRYVLVWITTVVPVADGHRAEIGEFLVVVGADA
jgi:serine/threonine protein kinase